MMNKDLIRGTLKPIILSVLKDRGRLYGYQINKLIAHLTNNSLILTDGALYPMLHKLEKSKIISSEIEHIGKRKRKYYKLTELGETESNLQIDELLQFMKTIVLILKPQ